MTAYTVRIFMTHTNGQFLLAFKDENIACKLCANISDLMKHFAAGNLYDKDFIIGITDDTSERFAIDIRSIAAVVLGEIEPIEINKRRAEVVN